MVSKLFKLLASIALVILLYFLGSLFYAWFTDYTPEPVVELAVSSTSDVSAMDTDTVTIFDWNIGYAGLGRGVDFFYDGGEQVRSSEEQVNNNLEGILSTLEEYIDSADFFLFQEVDVESKRSYQNNEYDRIGQLLSDYASMFGKNYDVGHIPIPALEPMGNVHSGIATFSKYSVMESFRYAFEGNFKFPYSVFFLDRCFMLNRLETKSGKELVLINTHNSAYDDGTLKKRQMAQLQKVLLEEYSKGNYVIVGGDWNQNPLGIDGSRPSMPADYPAEEWKCVYDPQTPTHRKLYEPYNPETTQTGIIDYYLISPNVDAIKVQTIDQQFEFSDHQPVVMRAVLR